MVVFNIAVVWRVLANSLFFLFMRAVPASCYIFRENAILYS